MVNGPSFRFCAQQSNGADANQGHERNEDVRNQHAACGEDEGHEIGSQGATEETTDAFKEANPGLTYAGRILLGTVNLDDGIDADAEECQQNPTRERKHGIARQAEEDRSDGRSSRKRDECCLPPESLDGKRRSILAGDGGDDDNRGEQEGHGSAVAFLNQDGRGVGLNGVEDEQDTGESHPHHHAALEEGAVKELVVTPLLPSAHACPSVKIPRLTVCLNLRWGQWFSGSALDVVFKPAHNGISLARMSFDLKPARGFGHPLQQNGNIQEGKGSDVEEHAPPGIQRESRKKGKGEQWCQEVADREERVEKTRHRPAKVSWCEFCRHGVGNGKDGTHAQTRGKAQESQCRWSGCKPTEQGAHRVPGSANDENFLATDVVRQPPGGNDRKHDAQGRGNREQSETCGSEMKFLHDRGKHATNDADIV